MGCTEEAQKDACRYNDSSLFIYVLTPIRQSSADVMLVQTIEQKAKGNSPFDGEKLGKACDVRNAVSGIMLQLPMK